MTKLKDLLQSIHESVETSTTEELKKACELIIRVQDMDSGERDCIISSWMKGPLFDGDIPSKSSRDTLVSEKFMAKVVVKGQDGYNACTYLGQRAYRIIQALQ